ncbi:MAG: DUF6448 family protein [Candidatus Zixiibacteriota bacterium]
MRRIIGLVIAVATLTASTAWAHCDGLDGPVVAAARKALESRNVDLVLVWVQEADEPLIREAFDSTLAVRALGPSAQSLADRYFFETLVRVHRAGEGAPYTGLKPAGRDLGPALPAADLALETGSLDSTLALLTGLIEHGIEEHFADALALREHAGHNVAAGRAYVRAYVEFIHYVEGIYLATQKAAGEHPGDAPPTGHQHGD